MTMLVTLEAAKADLRVDHDFEDEDIERKIKAASRVVLNYLKIEESAYHDSSGQIPLDAAGEPDVPDEVRMATLLMVREFFKSDKERSSQEANYLPTVVVSLLYPLRDPTLEP